MTASLGSFPNLGPSPHAASAMPSRSTRMALTGRMLHSAAQKTVPGGLEETMKVKSQKDLWAGLMFIGVGLFFTIWALTHYQMGTSVRMGPAYFPAVLGGLLAFLGALVLVEAFAMGDPNKEQVKVPFGALDVIVVVAIYVAAGFLAKFLRFSSDWAIIGATAVIAVLTVMRRPGAKPLILISGACVAYGYLM